MPTYPRVLQQARTVDGSGTYAGRNFAVIDLCEAPYNLRPGDDATTALQAAMDAVGVSKTSTDILFSRPGTYTLNGALQTGTNLGYTWNGQVLVPAISAAQSVAIRVRGASPISNGGSARPPGGTKLLSNATAGWIFDAKPSYTAYSAVDPWTNVWLMFKDLIIEAPINPQLAGGIRATICTSFSTKNVSVTATDITVAKTGTGEAIALPQNLNEFELVLEKTTVSGWPYGPRLTEHVTLRDYHSCWCNAGFITSGGGDHLNVFSHAGVENTPVVFKVDNAAATMKPLFVSGDLYYESPNVTPTALVDQPISGCVIGTLTVDVFNPRGSLPTTFSLIASNGQLDLANTRGAGGAYWSETHPRDNFQRAVTGVAGAGLSWPTLHPWWLDAGSQQVVGTAGSPGSLASTAGTARSTALVPSRSGMSGGESRVITGKFTLGATSPRVQLNGQWVIGGAYDKSRITLNVTPSAFQIVTTAAAVDTVLVDAGALVAAGSTHTFSLEIGINSLGIPTYATSYLDGAKVSTIMIPSATAATLTGIASPYIADGVTFYDAGSRCTSFTVTPTPTPVTADYASSDGNRLIIGGTSAPGTVDPTAAGYDIILCAGQSNMVGDVTSVADTTYFDLPHPRIRRWVASGSAIPGLASYRSMISQAFDPLGHPDIATQNGVGPSMEFARQYVDTIPDNRRVLLVPVAVSNTQLVPASGTTWNSTVTNSLYAQALNETMKAYAAAGPNSRIVAILWAQGETDALNSASGGAYQAALDALITAFRANLPGASSTTPFVIGGMKRNWVNAPNGTSVAIDAVHAATPSRVANTGYALGPTETTGIHYDAAEQRAFGRAMFRAYLATRLGITTTTDSLFDHAVWPPTASMNSLFASSANAVFGTGITAKVAGTVTAVWVPVCAELVGATSTVKFWASTGAGSPAATGTAVNRSTPGWQRVPLSTPATVTAGQLFVVSVQNGVGGVRHDPTGQAPWPWPSYSPRGLLYAPNAENMRYTFTTTANPSNTVGGGNTFTDVEFIPS